MRFRRLQLFPGTHGVVYRPDCYFAPLGHLPDGLQLRVQRSVRRFLRNLQPPASMACVFEVGPEPPGQALWLRSTDLRCFPQDFTAEERQFALALDQLLSQLYG